MIRQVVPLHGGGELNFRVQASLKRCSAWRFAQIDAVIRPNSSGEPVYALSNIAAQKIGGGLHLETRADLEDGSQQRFPPRS